jgi:hypothetical protein
VLWAPRISGCESEAVGVIAGFACKVVLGSY